MGPGAGPVDPSHLSGTQLDGNVQPGQGEFSSVTQVLWGTSINTTQLQRDLCEFLETFKKPRGTGMMMLDDQNDLNAEYDDAPHYITLLK